MSEEECHSLHHRALSSIGLQTRSRNKTRRNQPPTEKMTSEKKNPRDIQGSNGDEGWSPDLVDSDPESAPPRSKNRDKHPERQLYRPRASRQIAPASNDLRSRLDESLAHRRELESKLLDADSTIREKDEQIKGLTETITSLHSRDGIVSRDDNYLATEFSDVVNSVVEWTMRYFPKTKSTLITDPQQLPTELSNLILRITPEGGNLLALRETRLRVISSIVIENVYSRVFGGPLPGAVKGYDPMRVMVPLFEGTDLQIQRWRSLTFSLLTKSSEYERMFNMDVAMTSQFIDKLVSVLAPPESDTVLRYTELFKIVDRAAKLSVEVRKQLDVIGLESPSPGDPFDRETMEDMNCQYEIEELEAGGAIVQIAFSPAIRRQTCGSDGSLSKPPGNLVSKAKVTTMFPR